MNIIAWQNPNWQEADQLAIYMYYDEDELSFALSQTGNYSLNIDLACLWRSTTNYAKKWNLRLDVYLKRHKDDCSSKEQK